MEPGTPSLSRVASPRAVFSPGSYNPPIFHRLRDHLHTHSRTRRIVEGLTVAVCVAAAITATGRTETFEDFERRTLDWRFSHFEARKAVHPDIEVVEITDSDLDQVERAAKLSWPWPRTAYTLALKWLREAGAKAVFLDLSFQEAADRYVKNDQAFAAEVAKSGNVYVLATFGAPTQRHEKLLPALRERAWADAPPWMRRYDRVTPPFAELIPAAKGIVDPTYTVDDKDPDGIARRYPAGSAWDGKAFVTPAVALAADLLGAPPRFEADALVIGDRRIPVDDRGMFLLDWHGDFARRREKNKSPFNMKEHSLGGIIATVQKTAPRPYDPAEFKDKIVLIGASAEGLFDFKATPLGTALGVEIHAMALDNILHGEFVRRIPRGTVALAVWGLALFAGIISLALPIRFAVPLVAVAGASYSWGAYAAFGSHLVWVDLVAPLSALAFATLGAALVNFAVEGRQKRDIRNKFGTYLTPEYVQLLEENPGMFKLGGEERVGSAFFSDLSGFTAMSEKMTASELVSRMNEYLTLMTQSIKRFNGTVDKYEGDAIVAFWNAPVPQEDHAVRACRAALDNQAELAKLRVRWKESFGITVVARIGINTGKMIFGNMGSEEKFNYTMMGDPVNLAARLEGANKDYGTWIMIGPDTYELVKDAMECRELDLIKVKGKQIPVTVYEVLCEKGRLDPRTREGLDRYMIGLQAYRMKQFKAAERAFQEALEILPDDGPSKLYAERSKKLVAEPPSPHWTYIYEKQDK